MSFGPFLAAAFVLWPVMAVLGGQGFAPLVGLTGLAALAVSRPRLPPAPFALIGFGFIAWAALSELWAPGHPRLVSGSLLDGNFSVEARSVSAILLALMAALTIGSTLRASPAPRASGVVAVMLGVQAVLVIASTILSGPVLSAVYGEDARRLQEGAQNIGRSANTLALALPLLLPMLVLRLKFVGPALAALLAIGAVAMFIISGYDSALVAMIGMSAAIMFVAVLPRSGFRWLFGGLAGYIAAAPVLFALLIRALDGVAPHLPASFRSRLWSWEIVIGRMSDAPFLGHGLNATRTWKETFATRPDWLAQLPDYWKDYPVVPGHPHNMALQIWAETGMIGAVLAALSLVALAFHLPRPAELRPEIRFAAAGLAGAAASIFSFAYSLWNEGFWASLALAAAAIILWHRTLRETDE
ncbi:MAG: O-antigen ligase family protein [Hyphomonas sp.]|uniref:O-antigen ligase family protein n=1 Tax=Hyphomonas sp. TaxID=87 RepID=UPI0017AE18F3|nr:O-antigen ligase family protein [Hyphomonas sp.]MBA3068706.1 O-antigen ligase family protein [Hyphomonas sp.]MBU4063630.1 O-antigen ligase family protein [Alphaproteobacteria bacterium]MBU4165745.1 O-antigen ligase family protein [Alphaproteobacteria bacterium]MBU4568409.1 O-antigen ligase family protein [Alphaproteobacteria bacterium]